MNLNIKDMFDDLYTVMAVKQTFFEFILHLTFILLIFLFAVIFYWDSINRSVINNGRCKVMLDNSDVVYDAQIFDKSTQLPIIRIQYDNTKDHKVKVDCVCPTGYELNPIKNIPVYNYKTQKVETVDKFCMCNDNYKSHIMSDDIDMIDTNKITIDGDSFLAEYYENVLGFGPLNKGNYAEFEEVLPFPS